MQSLVGIAALLAAAWGIAVGRSASTPLFFRIVTYGLACYALGTGYELLRDAVIAGGALGSDALGSLSATGFSIGLVGRAGAFFFLFSSYFGALDSLADGREPGLARYRLGALAAPAAVVGLGAWLSALLGLRPVALLALVPVAATSYYALKHLVMPDVEMGIIRVMRPYNACVLLICLLQPVTLLGADLGLAHGAACALAAAAVLAVMPLARNGVSKWFL